MDPLEVAVYWAKQCGVAPRFMARSLGMKNTREVQKLLRRFSIRLSKQPSLTRLATVP
jgi:hypothetical protein